MTGFIVPNIFTAGTKAKAYEVNENFDAVKEELDTHQTSINANSTALTTLQTYIEGELKDEFEDLIKSNKTKFCLNSSYTPLLAVNSTDNSQLDFNVDNGTAYKNLVATNASGTSFTHTSLSSIDMSEEADGTYNIFVGTTGVPYAYKNTIYKQKNVPAEELQANDIWLDTSSEPLSAKKWSGTAWETFNDTPIGTAAVVSAAITAVTTADFNQNGYNVTLQTQAYRFPDYNNGVTKTWNTQYIADLDGWLWFYVASWSSNVNYLTLNDGVIPNSGAFSYNANGGAVTYSGVIPISAGDVYRFYGGNNAGSLIFFPAKGVN